MNKTLFQIIFSFGMILCLAGCGVLPKAEGNSAISASGTIQVESVRLAAEVSGRISEVKFNQGDLVKAGEVVFRLDDASILIQRKQAEAALQSAQVAQTAAQANLDLVKTGATGDQIRAAQANLDQAKANLKATQATLWDVEGNSRPEEISVAENRLDLARQSFYTSSATLTSQQLEDAATLRNQAQNSLSQLQSRRARLEQDKRTPVLALDAAANTISDAKAAAAAADQTIQILQDSSQPLYLQIASLRQTWDLAELNLTQAQARQTAIRAESDMTQEGLDAAQAAVDQAQATLDKAKKAYNGLNNSSQAAQLKTAWDELQQAQRDLNAMGRLAGTGNLEALINQLDAANAQRVAAEANLNNLKNGPKPEQVTAAEAQVDLARAKVVEAQTVLEQIDEQINKLAVKAPVEGLVMSRSFDPGEIATAGTAVVEIGDLDHVTLKVYVPEDQYGKIKLGQSVSVKADSFPGRTFTGSVSKISNQAEYTPRNVQTQETRSTTVYAIEIQLSNPDHALKPGMPADANF